MKFKIRVREGKIVWKNLSEREMFVERAEGKYVELSIDDRPSEKLRAYFEGCLVPVFFYTHPDVPWKTFKDAREALKKEFLPKKWGFNHLGIPFEQTPSLADLNRSTWEQFVTDVTGWMIENGISPTLIDSEAFKQWRDTVPDEKYYPPLQVVIDEYKRIKTNAPVDN